jgi:GT2 family glycosyltransferase
MLPLRYFRNEAQGPALARNHALREARGEYVAFTDDDCLPCPDWLQAYERAFELHRAACLGGRIVNFPEDGIFGVASQMLITFLYENAGRAGCVPAFFCSNNLAFRRTAVLAIGGFQEGFPLAAAEDRDICARWATHGELHFVPEAAVQHCQDLNAISFCSQHFRYGRGAFHFWSQRRAEGRAVRKMAPASFYVAMLLFPFGQTGALRALAISTLLALSQLCCAAGYFAERMKRR